MVWNFDPRKLVKDQQQEENKKIEDVIMDQEKLDLFKEEEEKALRKKSNIRDALDSATKIIREFNVQCISARCQRISRFNGDNAVLASFIGHVEFTLPIAKGH